MKKRYDWGSMEWLAGSDMQNASTISVARMSLLSGKTNERHRHPNCEEAIWIEKGSVEIHREDERTRHSAGHCVVVPAGASHSLKNLESETAELVLMYGAGERLYEPC